MCDSGMFIIYTGTGVFMFWNLRYESETFCCSNYPHILCMSRIYNYYNKMK